MDESTKTFNAMKEGPQEVQAVFAQIQIDKTMEQWRKKFQELGYTTDEINSRMVLLYGTLKQLSDAKLFDKNFVSFGQFIEFSFGELAKGGVDKFVDALNNGTLASMKFRDFVIDAFGAIEKKILELAVVNPILNMLFGATNQVLTPQSGGTATGGLIGKLL